MACVTAMEISNMKYGYVLHRARRSFSKDVITQILVLLLTKGVCRSVCFDLCTRFLCFISLRRFYKWNIRLNEMKIHYERYITVQ